MISNWCLIFHQQIKFLTKIICHVESSERSMPSVLQFKVYSTYYIINVIELGIPFWVWLQLYFVFHFFRPYKKSYSLCSYIWRFSKKMLLKYCFKMPLSNLSIPSFNCDYLKERSLLPKKRKTSIKKKIIRR